MKCLNILKKSLQIGRSINPYPKINAIRSDIKLRELGACLHRPHLTRQTQPGKASSRALRSGDIPSLASRW